MRCPPIQSGMIPNPENANAVLKLMRLTGVVE
jgi:hypothetical protein